ncbi:hypothetical protein NIES39_A08380 [Arthrospira platensis NIES-39]|nr:hypothetical protein NIES39_A08380 [Arthrospira platensis NIES-39]
MTKYGKIGFWSIFLLSLNQFIRIDYCQSPWYHKYEKPWGDYHLGGGDRQDS